MRKATCKQSTARKAFANRAVDDVFSWYLNFCCDFFMNGNQMALRFIHMHGTERVDAKQKAFCSYLWANKVSKLCKKRAAIRIFRAEIMVADSTGKSKDSHETSFTEGVVDLIYTDRPLLLLFFGHEFLFNHYHQISPSTHCAPPRRSNRK